MEAAWLRSGGEEHLIFSPLKKRMIMSRKNSPVSVLQQNRTPFLLIGLLLALSFVILAFQLRFPALEVEPPDVAYIANPEYVEEWSTHRPKQKYRQKQQPAARQKIVTTTALPDLPDDDQRQAEAPPIDDEFFHLPTEKTTDRVIREPVRNPEQMPAFPGGEAGLMGYLSKTPYCEAARDIGISGMVYISFVVGRDGRVREV